MFKFQNLLLAVVILIFSAIAYSQNSLPLNWHLLDKSKDGIHGVSSERAYADFLQNKKYKTIIVAVLDSGVDSDHEDLKEVMWTNSKEIPGNLKDDDNNGYIDDIHGWNFIGGKTGNISSDTYETTRLYAQLRYKYENADRDKLTKAQKKEYDLFLTAKKEVENRRKSAQTNLDNISHSEKMITTAINALATALGDKALTLENIDQVDEGDSKNLSMGIAIAKQILTQNNDFKTVEELKHFIEDDFVKGKKHYSNELNYAFNPEFNPRDIVGDNYNDVSEKYYGNNDVQGPDASHGTHVAGLIAAKRGNEIGMDGIADHVRIMSVRCVPDGDERDKDVANAIRYAVDNGASIINMSFGKGNSPNKDAVDAAIKYAAEKDVLIVHAAGNAASDNDKILNFPNRMYAKKKFLSCNKAENWLEVGALSFESAPDLVAGFSNYGKKSVDLFSPGVQIYSTTPGNNYQHMQGTSMASPVAAGVAAMIRSYYPNLTAKQVRTILLKSTSKQEAKVLSPGTKKEVKMSDISVTGGIINAYEAIKMANQVKGKKKIKSSNLYDSNDEVKSTENPRS